MLRITSFGKQFWFFFIGADIVLTVFTLLYRRLIVVAGLGATAAIWIMIVLVLMSIFTFGLWKYAQIEKVDIDPMSKTNRSS
jgi:hypothetical protein